MSFQNCVSIISFGNKQCNFVIKKIILKKNEFCNIMKYGFSNLGKPSKDVFSFGT